MSVVSRETDDRLTALEALVLAENQRQNLVSTSSTTDFYNRHVEDSLQLLPHVRPGILLDIGSGAGFPGLVLACCLSTPIHLVEPRARRALFLQEAAEALVLPHVSVHCCPVERLQIAPVATITARAVAALPKLFGMALHLSNAATRWILPKGRSAQAELDAVLQTWQGSFRLVPSTTDPEAAIVLAEAVRRRSS